jgi:hypothetical protein
VYNGYFSAEGTFSTEEAAAGKDTDSVSVAVPTSDAVAGDEIPVKPKVSDSSAGIPGEGDHVDDGGALLRASWTSKRHLGYADRTVRMEYRLKEGPDTAWANPVSGQRADRRKWLC